jgi:hypothetical protein
MTAFGVPVMMASSVQGQKLEITAMVPTLIHTKKRKLMPIVSVQTFLLPMFVTMGPKLGAAAQFGISNVLPIVNLQYPKLIRHQLSQTAKS